MDFLKKHYEKVLLGVVLIGLAGAVAFLPFKISSDKDSLNEISQRLTNPKVRELTNVNLALPTEAIKRVSTPVAVDFAAPNRLFNPMPWQKTAPPEERLIPTTKVGPTAAVVTNISPLYLRIALDPTITVSDSGAKYLISVQKEADPSPAKRGKKQYYCTLNSKNEVFTLVEVKGKPEDPSQLIIELNDSGERVALSREKPYTRVDGHIADIRYEPEKKFWADRRIGMSLLFAGEEYNIVAINQSEVVLSAKSNGKKWSIKYNPVAAS